MKIKINNQLIAEACRASIKNLIKETEEFNNNQISRETLLQCMFQSIEEDGLYSNEAYIVDTTIYIQKDSEYGCEVTAIYNGDLGYFEFTFIIEYESKIDYNEGSGDGYWEPIEYASCELAYIKNVKISPIKVSGDIETEIPMNSELYYKIKNMLNFELDDEYAEKLVEDWADYNPWENDDPWED